MAFLVKSVRFASTKHNLPQTFLATSSLSNKNRTHRLHYRSQHNGEFDIVAKAVVIIVIDIIELVI